MAGLLQGDPVEARKTSLNFCCTKSVVKVTFNLVCCGKTDRGYEAPVLGCGETWVVYRYISCNPPMRWSCQMLLNLELTIVH